MGGDPLQLRGFGGRTASYGGNVRRVGVKKIPAVATTAGGKNGPVGPRVTRGARAETSGRPWLSPAGRDSYGRLYRCTGISPTGSTKSGNDHNRPYHGPAGLLANPLGSSYVVRTTDRAGVMLDVELRLAVQTDVGERFRGRQPCRAFGPIQDTHRDHTHRWCALTKKSQDSLHPPRPPIAGDFDILYILFRFGSERLFAAPRDRSRPPIRRYIPDPTTPCRGREPVAPGPGRERAPKRRPGAGYRGSGPFGYPVHTVGHKYVNALVDVRGHASRRRPDSHRSGGITCVRQY